MKIAVIGYSGAGKSTLARLLGEQYCCEVLHLDAIQFTANWEERDRAEAGELVKTFLDTHDSWIIDGNYSQFHHARRLEEADQIVFLNFGPFTCLSRVTNRYETYKGRSREDMAEGCNEKLDLEFIRWVLWDGRTKARRGRFHDIVRQYRDKTVVIHNQKELGAYMASAGK